MPLSPAMPGLADCLQRGTFDSKIRRISAVLQWSNNFVLLPLASQARQEKGHWEVQEGQGPSQQVWRQSQEEGTLSLNAVTCNVPDWLTLISYCCLHLFLSRSGPREKWGISSIIWSSSTRQPMRSCTKKSPTTSSSPLLLCLRGWRSVVLWQGMPSKNCSPKVSSKYLFQSLFPSESTDECPVV